MRTLLKILSLILVILAILLCLVSFSAYKLHTELNEAEILAEQSRRAYEAEGFLWQAYINRRDDETFFLKFLQNSEVKDGKLDIYLYGSNFSLYSEEVEKLFREFMSEYSDVIRVYSYSEEEISAIGRQLLRVFADEYPVDFSDIPPNQIYSIGSVVKQSGCIVIDYPNEKYSYKAQKMAAEYSEKYNVRIAIEVLS